MSDKLPIKPAHLSEAAIKTTTAGSSGAAVARTDRPPPRYVVLDGDQVVGAAATEQDAQHLAEGLGGRVEKIGALSLLPLVAGTLLTFSVVFAWIGLPVLIWSLYSSNQRRKMLERAAQNFELAKPPPLSGRAAELVDHSTVLQAKLPSAGIPEIAQSDLADSLKGIQSDLHGLFTKETGMREGLLRMPDNEDLLARLASVESAYDSLGEALAAIDVALTGDAMDFGTDLGAVTVKAQAARQLAKRLQ